LAAKDAQHPEGIRRAKGLGIDSVQALLIAMMNIGAEIAEIYASDAHRSGKLMWDRPGGGYGFPLVPGIRDLYEGDDKLL
jgi:hypothetical protein